MSSQTFKALVVTEESDGTFSRGITDRTVESLPDNEVLIRVHFSALNYKDALSASGNKGVTRNYPHTPGVDAAGVVEESGDNRFREGEPVIVTSFDLGENTSGGFGQYIRVPGDWIVPLPDSLTLKESMMYGTAGFTAGYGVLKLLGNGTRPGGRPVLVTGATGGVGSLAVSLLDAEGFTVIAATGKEDQHEFLRSIGADEVIDRDTVYPGSSRPLLSSRWDGAIDTVGGKMLDAVLRQAGHNGTVACCGNVLGGELSTSIYPFILKGVSLMGIDSGRCLMPMRKKIWDMLAGKWKNERLDYINRECTLEELEKEISTILDGQQVGHVVVNMK